MDFLFNVSTEADNINVLSFVEGFIDEYEIGPLSINTIALNGVVAGSRSTPCKDGLDGASVFKKAATFALLFVAQQPLTNSLPRDKFPADLVEINNHQNGLLGILIALKALHKAQIRRKDGNVVTIKNPIEISGHSLIDLVDAVTGASVQTGFQLLTLLFEQLAYKTNPDCQYTPAQI